MSGFKEYKEMCNKNAKVIERCISYIERKETIWMEHRIFATKEDKYPLHGGTDEYTILSVETTRPVINSYEVHLVLINSQRQIREFDLHIQLDRMSIEKRLLTWRHNDSIYHFGLLNHIIKPLIQSNKEE